MSSLDKLFGSATRTKLLKLFLFNPELTLTSRQVIQKTKSSPQNVRKELTLLTAAGFLRKRGGAAMAANKNSKSKKGKRSRSASKIKNTEATWRFDHSFSYKNSFVELLSGQEAVDRDRVSSLISKSGRIKLLILSGIFIKDDDSRLDILIVGDNIKQKTFESIISIIEAEMGRELRYSLFATKDFMYRLSMYDKLVRDVLDYPHQKVVNKIGL